MSTISLTKLYDLLSEKVGKESAESLTVYIESKIKAEVQGNSKLLATKEDIANLKIELKEDIANVRTELANVKAELIKWMFIFWIGQIAVTFGFILLFLNK
ncbi:MAG: hypothetical protein WBP45_05585 [Daejeonella sp.]